MTQLRIGFVVNGSACPDRERLTLWVAKCQPTTMVIMDNHDLAVDLYNASGGKTKVAHRAYDPAEGGEWKTTSTEEYCNNLTNWGHPEIYRQVLCEPAIISADLPGMFIWLARVLDILRQRGYKAVYGNFGVGCIHPTAMSVAAFNALLAAELEDDPQNVQALAYQVQARAQTGDNITFDQPLPFGILKAQHIDDGQFDALLMLEHEHRGWHVLGVHEYTGIDLEFGVGQWAQYADNPVDYFLTPEYHQPENWPKKADLPVARVNGALPPYWHIRRSDWLTIRARELGLGDPLFWRTEKGWDGMPDIGAVYSALTKRWGIAAGYANLRRMNSLANVWKAYWPEWSADRAAFEQMKWLDSIYPENYIGGCQFMWTADHWARDGFDMSQNLEYLGLLQAYATTPEPEPVPIGKPWQAVALSIVLFLVCIAVTLGGILSLSRQQAYTQGVSPMADLLNELFSIPVFAGIAYTSAIVYFLVEVWKRYIVGRLPAQFRVAPETVAVVLIGLFMVVHGVAVEYQYDNALKEAAKFISDLINVMGPYILGGVATSAATNYSYNKLRGQRAPGFNARNITKK